jgi:hypothetical protein
MKKKTVKFKIIIKKQKYKNRIKTNKIKMKIIDIEDKFVDKNNNI